MIEELRTLIGTEFTLLEMDNAVLEILETGTTILGYGEEDLRGFIEDEEFSYTVSTDVLGRTNEAINIHFKVIEEDEDGFKTMVIITDVEEL